MPAIRGSDQAGVRAASAHRRASVTLSTQPSTRTTRLRAKSTRIWRESPARSAAPIRLQRIAVLTAQVGVELRRQPGAIGLLRVSGEIATADHGGALRAAERRQQTFSPVRARRALPPGEGWGGARGPEDAPQAERGKELPSVHGSVSRGEAGRRHRQAGG